MSKTDKGNKEIASHSADLNHLMAHSMVFKAVYRCLAPRLDLSDNITENWKRWRQRWDSFEIASRLFTQETNIALALLYKPALEMRLLIEAIEIYYAFPICTCMKINMICPKLWNLLYLSSRLYVC